VILVGMKMDAQKLRLLPLVALIPFNIAPIISQEFQTWKSALAHYS
jgi:hypothetical protein